MRILKETTLINESGEELFITWEGATCKLFIHSELSFSMKKEEVEQLVYELNNLLDEMDK